MKKIFVTTILALSLFLCFSIGTFAFSSSMDHLTLERNASVPTVPWNLIVTNDMASQGILTDWANRMGHYPYSAYVTGNMVYSNYYFIPQTEHKFVLHGRTMYPVSLAYVVRMEKRGSTYFCTHGISPQTSEWEFDYFTRGYTFGYAAYFGI